MTASRGIRTKRGVRQAFVETEQGKHLCKCGCGDPVPIRLEHFNKGIPRFIHGHNVRVTHPTDAHRRAAHLRATSGPAIANEYEAGSSCEDLAEKYGVSVPTISSIVKESGGQIRPYQIRDGHPYYKNWGPDHPYWRGGSHVTVRGYRKVWLDPAHPFASEMSSKSESYVYEHRLVMALHLGRPLHKGETVHHIDGDRLNNDISNLQLRQGAHNVGVKMGCKECGSYNVGPLPLD